MESLGFTGEVRGTPEQEGMRALPSVSEHEQPRYIPRSATQRLNAAPRPRAARELRPARRGRAQRAC